SQQPDSRIAAASPWPAIAVSTRIGRRPGAALRFIHRPASMPFMLGRWRSRITASGSNERASAMPSSPRRAVTTSCSTLSSWSSTSSRSGLSSTIRILAMLNPASLARLCLDARDRFRRREFVERHGHSHLHALLDQAREVRAVDVLRLDAVLAQDLLHLVHHRALVAQLPVYVRVDDQEVVAHDRDIVHDGERNRVREADRPCLLLVVDQSADLG